MSSDDNYNHIVNNQEKLLKSLQHIFGLDPRLTYSIENEFMMGEKHADPSVFTLYCTRYNYKKLIGSFRLYKEFRRENWLLKVDNDNLTLYPDFDQNIVYRLSVDLDDSFSFINWKIRVYHVVEDIDNFLLFETEDNVVRGSTFFNHNKDSFYRYEKNYLLTKNTAIHYFLGRFEPFICLFCDHLNIFKTYSFKEILDALDDDAILDDMKTVAEMSCI